MNSIILKAAGEIGLDTHVSVAPFDGRDPLVTVSYSTKAVTGHIPSGYLMEPGLGQVKTILTEMARMAKSR